MPIDMVCWMHVDRTAENTSEFKGKKYYFCSSKCKKEFDEAPDKYLGVKSPMKMPE